MSKDTRIKGLMEGHFAMSEGEGCPILKDDYFSSSPDSSLLFTTRMGYSLRLNWEEGVSSNALPFSRWTLNFELVVLSFAPFCLWMHSPLLSASLQTRLF